MTTTIVPATAAAHRPAVAGTWEIDLNRSALEVDYTVCGVVVWRARLRPLEMRIELPVDDEDAPQLCGLIAARPAFTSVPGTRAWFLRRKGLGLPISVAGEAGRPGCSKRPSARVSVGRHEWSAAVTVRATSIGDDRAIVAAAGVIIPRPDTMVPAAQTRFELAAEFLRCA